ncbi:hypothetical protein K1T71_000738 [Dendrolimus kikuchii]|uniref:Uncharacterized protein n=1 Tax=Dendrolimus kikuchii TaxID=765133 RepID=A0ACC1DKI0_9NEOP|nr:hypothetical protein K1T71_000738 [Dendrolimus kikuchii]
MKKGDISYHHFPKDPTIKEKWITATGRKDWFPTKYSTICSSHITQEDFDNTKNIRRLYPNTYPKTEVWEQHDDNLSSRSSKRRLTCSESGNNSDITETPRKKRLIKQLAHAQNIITKKI